MLVKMLETRRGVDDNFDIRRYERDKTYDMQETVAHTFVSRGQAEYITPPAPFDINDFLIKLARIRAERLHGGGNAQA